MKKENFMVGTMYEVIYIHPHMHTLAEVYPLSVLDIAKIWKINNYCSMIGLEQIIKKMVSTNNL
jgi:hypothetical protein